MTGPDATATLQGTAAAIPLEYREGVALQLAALMQQAQLVLEFPLPDEAEPAPVFTP